MLDSNSSPRSLAADPKVLRHDPGSNSLAIDHTEAIPNHSGEYSSIRSSTEEKGNEKQLFLLIFAGEVNLAEITVIR